MKKIYDNWRDDVLNEFAPSYDLDDQESDIDQYITPSSDLIQKAIQGAIDNNRSLHASGRPINSKLLQGLIKENDVKELIELMSGLREDDYLRKLSLSPFNFQDATGRLNDISAIYKAAARSKGKSIAVLGASLQRYIDGVFMSTKNFQELRENISNATEAFGLILTSSRYDIVQAIRLFTGASVNTVRNPPKFNPKLAEPIEQSRKEKELILQKMLPAIDSKDSDYNVVQSFISIIFHVHRVANPSFMLELEAISSNKGKELITAYFDRVIKITKPETVAIDELSISTFQKEKFIKMAKMVGHSTKSRKFQEFLASMDRVKSMIPIYKRFQEHYTKFLSVPDQEDYEVANDILKMLAKKPSKYNYRIYRGMYVKASLFPEGIKEGMEFNFYDISSWSREMNIALSFCTTPPEGHKKEAGDKSVIFTMRMKRGTYIDHYSAYDGEEEVVTGGKVKILEVTELHKLQGPILRVLCEQI